MDQSGDILELGLSRPLIGGQNKFLFRNVDDLDLLLRS